MKEDDAAKIAYARLIQSVQETRELEDYDENDVQIPLPDFIHVNGKIFGFGLINSEV